MLPISALALLGACAEPPTPEPAGLHLHRLNAIEYANSLAAVLGVESQVAAQLPADAPSHGFDNIADVLTTSPLLVELYGQATDEVLDAASAPGGLVHERLGECVATRDEASCASELIEELTTRAWRRPPSEAELARLLAVSEEARALGLDGEQAVAAALQAVLMSPNFLFRIERTAAEPGEPLDAYELAARLSYFLWSAPPDEALLADARSGALLDPAVLEAHARRMLDDPRAAMLADNFAAQWLGFRYLDDTFKDTARYPEFTPELRASMAEEPRLLFIDLLTHDRDLRELLTSEISFVDQRLAELYGLELPEDSTGFVRVELGDAPRRGLLTQAGWLSVFSYPFTTSPARRGSWVLGNLLCIPPAAPPAGVDIPVDLEPNDKREQFEAHRANPLCASCHQSLDAIGLAFEGYDAIGEHRTLDGGEPIDTSGSLPEGTSFSDPIEMAALISEDPAFPACAVQKTLTYALGRGLGGAELEAIDGLAAELAARGYGTKELFVLIATSEPFRTRAQEVAP